MILSLCIVTTNWESPLHTRFSGVKRLGTKHPFDEEVRGTNTGEVGVLWASLDGPRSGPPARPRGRTPTAVGAGGKAAIGEGKYNEMIRRENNEDWYKSRMSQIFERGKKSTIM